MGHDGPVRSVAFSRDDRLVLTGSSDCTARVWSPETGACQLTIRSAQHNNPSKEGAQGNQPLAHEVCHALFFYLDKFIVLSSGSRVYVYNYHLDASKDDIKHVQTPSRYKAAAVVSHRASSVTALGVHNQFLSCMLLTGTSDHKLHCHDLSSGQCVRTYDNAHNKPVQCICMHQPSSSACHPQESYELFLTAGLDDAVRLWDLRSSQKSCVRLFKGHANRVHAVQCSLSPCLRYVGCGSEDQRAYMYDIGSGKLIERMRGHSDAVVDLKFNPIHPQLVTAGMDGKLRFYSES